MVCCCDSILHAHCPSLLKNHSPASIWMVAYMHSKLLVICIYVIPVEGKRCSVNNMVILNELRGFFRVGSGVHVHRYPKCLLPFAETCDISRFSVRDQYKKHVPPLFISSILWSSSFETLSLVTNLAKSTYS